MKRDNRSDRRPSPDPLQGADLGQHPTPPATACQEVAQCAECGRDFTLGFLRQYLIGTTFQPLCLECCFQRQNSQGIHNQPSPHEKLVVDNRVLVDHFLACAGAPPSPSLTHADHDAIDFALRGLATAEARAVLIELLTGIPSDDLIGQ